MHELAVLTAVVVAIMAVTTVVAGIVGRTLLVIENILVGAAVLVALFVMAFVGAEVGMRYLFNAPIPGHLEGSELLMPMIVFLALSYTQATHGHVGMDLVLDMLPPRGRRFATMGTLLVSIFICSILAYFSSKNALQLWSYDDVTMSPPYFKTWPSGAAIGLGYILISLRMYVQLLHLYKPDRFPANEPRDSGFHAVE
jgi:TRAP-type C4-dicarboxylate transport system permease small subunit